MKWPNANFQMFYVLYSPKHKQYLDSMADYCSYDKAERFDKPSDVDLSVVTTNSSWR